MQVRKVLKSGITAILCIGESKEEYESGLNSEVSFNTTAHVFRFTAVALGQQAVTHDCLQPPFAGLRGPTRQELSWRRGGPTKQGT